MAAASATTYAQQQGRGGRGNRDDGQGGRGGRGGQGDQGGGFRGPGGFGGFGGFGGSVLNLAGLEPVQEELKITEAQKTKITKLTTDTNSKRREYSQNMRQQMDASRSQLRNQQRQFTNNLQQNQPYDARDQALGGIQGTGGGFGVNPYDTGQNGNGVDPGALRRNFRDQENEARRQGFEMMRQGMQQLEGKAEQSLARILDKNQLRRLYELQLQLEGPFAVLKPDVAERLELREIQADEIRQVQAEAGEVRRQIAAQSRDLFRSMRESQGNGGGNGNGQAARGNNRGRGNNGGQGGPGGNRGGFDREAMRQFMERPEVKAQMEESRKREQALTERSYALVYKSLDKPQVSTFKKMLGEPFDLNLIRQAMMRGGPGGPGGLGGPGGPRNTAGTPANNNTAGTTAARNESPAAKADVQETTASTATKSAAPKAAAPKSSSGIKSTRGRGSR
jgi:hypothetical protein